MLIESFVVHAFCDNEFMRNNKPYCCTEAAKVVFDQQVPDHRVSAMEQLEVKGWKFFADGKCLCPGCEEFGKKDDN